MAYERNPNNPYRADDLTRPDFDADAPYRRNRVEYDPQADPELAEGRASSAKIAIFALGLAVILGAIFYGLNSSSLHQSGTLSTAQKSAPNMPLAAPPATKGANPAPGVTTGLAPVQTPPPASTNPPASK